MTNVISPATAMHYAETVGKMPPRYEKGKRFYPFSCEGEWYSVDVLKDGAPSDMHPGWAKEVNKDAVNAYELLNGELIITIERPQI